MFSYFRDVLDRVTRAAQLAVPGAVLGPLTGSTPAPERQRLLYDPAADGVEDPESDVYKAERFVNLHPRDWFTPFRK